MVRSTEDNHVDPVALLEENLSRYRQMLRLAEETHREILKGDVGRLGASITRRQQIQTEISARDKLIEQARPHLANKNTDQKVTELVEHCAATIAEIHEVDEKTRSLMQEEGERLRKGIERMRQGRKSLRTYDKRTPSVPRFLDRRG
jgi:DNA repair ATPase RecN